MIEYPINSIIPSLDKQGDIVIPMSWKMGPDKQTTVMTCFKLTKAEASELAERLTKLTREK